MCPLSLEVLPAVPAAPRWPLLPGSRLWPLVQDLLQNPTWGVHMFPQKLVITGVISGFHASMEDWQSFITKNIPRPNKHPSGLSSQVRGSGSGQPVVLWQAAFLICAPICSAPLPTALCPWDKIQNIWRTPLQIPSIVFYTAAAGCHQIIIWVIIDHNPTMSWSLRGLALLKWSLVRSTYPTCTCSAFLWPFAHCQHVLQKAINAARMPFEPGQAVPSSPQLARQNCAAHTSQKIQKKQSN